MNVWAILLCICVLFVYLVQSQNIDEGQHATLQNMIDYTKQFEHDRNPERRQASDLGVVDSSKYDEDPVFRELFKEFLVQYQQLTSDRKNEVLSTTTTTTTTTEASSKVEFPAFPTVQRNPPRSRRPVIPNANLSPETAFVAQNRRGSIRRKSNNPEATRSKFSYLSTTTPFSTQNRGSFPHHESTIETNPTFPSLRQKYFSVETQTTKRPISTKRPVPKLSLVTPTTPVTQTMTEEPVVATQPLKFKIAHNFLKPASKLQSKNSSKSETAQESEPKFDEEEFRHQAESAKYEFASEIDDEITGSANQREEVRDGLAVKGKYSYSDGYYMRTVHYEADDKGYRVVKEEVEPLSGPHANPEGHAKVSSYVAGNVVNYEITQDDISKKDQKLVFNEVTGVEENDEQN